MNHIVCLFQVEVKVNVVYNPIMDHDTSAFLYSPCPLQETIQHTIMVKIEEVSNIIFPQDSINNNTFNKNENEKLSLDPTLQNDNNWGCTQYPSLFYLTVYIVCRHILI